MHDINKPKASGEGHVLSPDINKDFLAWFRWWDKIICPFCQHSHQIYKNLKRYKCMTCRKSFSSSSGTPMNETKLELEKWIEIFKLNIELRYEPMSWREKGRRLNVQPKTVRRCLRIILDNDYFFARLIIAYEKHIEKNRSEKIIKDPSSV